MIHNHLTSTKSKTQEDATTVPTSRFDVESQLPAIQEEESEEHIMQNEYITFTRHRAKFVALVVTIALVVVGVSVGVASSNRRVDNSNSNSNIDAQILIESEHMDEFPGPNGAGNLDIIVPDTRSKIASDTTNVDLELSQGPADCNEKSDAIERLCLAAEENDDDFLTLMKAGEFVDVPQNCANIFSRWSQMNRGREMACARLRICIVRIGCGDDDIEVEDNNDEDDADIRPTIYHPIDDERPSFYLKGNDGDGDDDDDDDDDDILIVPPFYSSDDDEEEFDKWDSDDDEGNDDDDWTVRPNIPSRMSRLNDREGVIDRFKRGNNYPSRNPAMKWKRDHMGGFTYNDSDEDSEDAYWQN